MGGVINWLTETAKSGFHQFFIKPIEWGMDQLIPDFDIPKYDIPEYGNSPTYGNKTGQIANLISEGTPVARCYGRCKIGANKIRFNNPDAADLRSIFGLCVGEISNIDECWINDIEWDTLIGPPSKTEYVGTRAQTPDARFTDEASAYRGMAYVAATFDKQNSQIGSDPHLTAVVYGLLCAPIGGGAKEFTWNNAVVLYDWYTEVEGYSADDINLNSFKSLELLCAITPDGGTISRYKFNFSFDTDISINDAKKTIWQSFNGRVIMSQGKLKAVWDSAQMANGSGGLTAKTVSHAFTEDNIVKDSLTWHQPERPNIVRIHYLDETEFKFQKTSVEVKDAHDISINGEILYEETCWFITQSEIARRRAQGKFNKFKYTDYVASLSALSGAGDLEVYDLVTVTDTLPGWTAKQFLVTQKGEDQYGRMQFILDAYYAGVYDDAQVGTQPGYGSNLPNPKAIPYEIAVGDITLAEATSQTFHWSPAVNVTFVQPTTDSFWSHVEVWISTDDVTFTFYGITSAGTGFTVETTGAMFQPGATLYVKLLSVSESGVKDSLTNITSKSIVLSSVIRLGSYYVGPYDFWGGNAAIGNAATKIVMGNLDGVPKIALGASADAITFAGTQSGFFVDGDGNLRAGGTQSLKWNPSTSRLTIGDWIMSPNGIADNFTEADAKVLIDRSNTLIRLGPTISNYLCVDGDYSGAPAIYSSNYVSGMAGAGFLLKSDLLEVGNIACRGIFRTAVFQKDVISAIGGNVFISKGADVLDGNMSASGGSGTSAYGTGLYHTAVYHGVSSPGTIRIEGNETFALGDMLRIKDGNDDEWMEVTDITNAPTYEVTRDKGAQYGVDANPAWKKGATIVNYGQPGDGAIYLTASETNAPYIGVVTHAGSPWDTITTRLRIGNLNGFLGYESDLYGIAIGETNAYLKYDPTNGLAINGPDITMQAGRTLTLSGATINMTAGTFTVSANGKIAINTTDALEIQAAGNVKVLAGADIRLIGSDSDPGNIFFEGTSYSMKCGSDADGNRFYISPETDNVIDMFLGSEAPWGSNRYAKSVTIGARGDVDLLSRYDGDNETYITVKQTSTISLVTFATSLADNYKYIEIKRSAAQNHLSPLTDKYFNLGRAAAAWDDAYADDWHDVADFYHLDTRDDLAAIWAIKGSGIISDVTGLELIDDNTIPKWMLSKHKKYKEEFDDKGKIINSWNKGDVMYNSEGKPYLSLKLMDSLLMGAIRQLDAKIEKIIKS